MIESEAEVSKPLLKMQGVEKSFPGVKALRGVSLTLHAGEVLAVLGENGAGKSTLMKVLGGAHAADAGKMEIDGREIQFHSPRESSAAGIAVIYQEFNLVPGLTASENIFLGQEITRRGRIDIATERRKAKVLFQRLGTNINLDVPCRQLNTSQQQLVEIAKALAFDARILVMDEPTAALTSREVESLFKIIAALKQQGLGIIYISHRLDEIFLVADRVAFLRDGENVGESAIGGLTRKTMIEYMVGRELKDEFPKRSVSIGEPRLLVQNLSNGCTVRNVSLTVRRGEIVALTGLVGAGRTETVRLVFGADARGSGEVQLDGKLLNIRSPRDAIAAGIGLLTEDRKLQGLVLEHSVIDNFGLPNLDHLSRNGFVQKRQERREFQQYSDALRIKVSSPDHRVGHLSGGNQQKVVLAKWLARHCEVLIFDEPTRGIDVGTKFEIYTLMNELVASGKSILMISSELSEVLGMADRIIVMHEGRVTGEIQDVRSATQEQVMELAVA